MNPSRSNLRRYPMDLSYWESHDWRWTKLILRWAGVAAGFTIALWAYLLLT